MMSIIWAHQALTASGWAHQARVELDGDRIVSVTPDSPPEGHCVGILLPAPTNLHSHGFQRGMAGLTERRSPAGHDSFWTWRDLLYRFLERLTPEYVEALTAYAQLQMAEAGFAAVAEFHYVHHQPDGTPYDAPGEMSARIAAASETTGLGLTLLPVLYEQGGADGRELLPRQRRLGTAPDQFAKVVEGAAGALAELPEDTRLGIAPHSLRAVSPEGLAAAVALAGERPIHIHLAEQEAEVEEVLAHLGARPVEWLLGNADVGPSWCPIHCTRMTPDETEALAATGAVAGLCPVTEANLGDGVFDGRRFQTAGGRYGVGTDSNIRISLCSELRMLEYSQRLRDRARAVLAEPDRSTGRVLFEAAARNGAQAAGRDAGAIAPGKLADLMALHTEATDLDGLEGDTALDAWIFTGNGRQVSDVWSAGRHIVQHGRHTRTGAITGRYRAAMARLKDSL